MNGHGVHIVVFLVGFVLVGQSLVLIQAVSLAALVGPLKAKLGHLLHSGRSVEAGRESPLFDLSGVQLSDHNRRDAPFLVDQLAQLLLT